MHREQKSIPVINKHIISAWHERVVDQSVLISSDKIQSFPLFTWVKIPIFRLIQAEFRNKVGDFYFPVHSTISQPFIQPRKLCGNKIVGKDEDL